MRVLITTQPGAGHWRPLAPLAQALMSAGHGVRFATTPDQCPYLTVHGFDCAAVGRPSSSDPPIPGNAATDGPIPADAVWVHHFAGSRLAASLPDLLALCRAWQPDLIVREISEFGGYLAAEVLRIPQVAVQISAYRPQLHALIAPRLHALRASLGLPADLSLASLYRPLLLTPAPPSYHDPTVPLPPATHPFRFEPFDRSPGEEDALVIPGHPPATPLVAASLGTVHHRTPGVFDAILAGLRDEPVRLIATIGTDQDPEAFGVQSPHIQIVRYMPQSLLFPSCDLVITHGGFGTVMSAIRHGLPMVLLPIAADQPDNARRCQELGVGIAIDATGRTPEAIRTAVRTILGQTRYRERAARLQVEQQRLPPVEQVVRWLEELVGNQPQDEDNRRAER